ncbi:YwaF family protein [Mesomycoplasma ovipneumoniae]|uniref:YwaF family protein n=1 Tax=Mesomycoplasma ovipneumoniae TaxID=29562 RepID=UPI0024AC9B1B|nr:YwaF family protein [Mesomycoplasma ovipneumoniae]WHF53464.1 YwaF family protein [Mesomycoplasma ovipneumoniae]
MFYFDWRKSDLDANSYFFIVYIGLILGLLSVLVLYFFRKNLETWYVHKNQIQFKVSLFYRVKNWFVFIGVLIWFFSYISRTIILEINDYIYKWEYLPLHLCRLIVLICASLMIFNRTNWAKYIVIPGFLGSILALSFPQIGFDAGIVMDDIEFQGIKLDQNVTESELINLAKTKNLGINWAPDNYFFWEFIFSHLLSLVLPFFLTFINGKNSKLDIKSFWKSVLFTFLMASFTFFLSWIIEKIIENQGDNRLKVAWNGNWFYMGKDGQPTIGELGKWPWNFPVLTIIFLFAFFIVFFTKMFLEKLNFYLLIVNSKIEIKHKPKSWKQVLSQNNLSQKWIKLLTKS